MAREFYYRWEWDLASSREAFWPYISNTDRFNRDTGLPSVETLPALAGQSPGARHLRMRMMGVTLEWIEEAFEWTRPSLFHVMRRYTRGAIREMRVRVELEAKPDGGTHLVYQVWSTPANLLGSIISPLQIGVISARSFDRVVRVYDRLAMQGKSLIEMPARVQFVTGGKERLESLANQLEARGASLPGLKRLVELLESADDFSVMRMRPYALADHWNLPRRTVLELFLLATRTGLLDLRWELLCPNCRTAKHRADNLSGIPSQYHCDTCHIDFSANFEHSVEVVFYPNAAIRLAPEQLDYCVAGPQITPHVIAQQLLVAGEQCSIEAPLEPGRYRLRMLGMPGGQFISVAADGKQQVVVPALSSGWADDEIFVDPQSRLDVHNATGSDQLFLLERTAWSDQAATAADVTTLQTFRDLFANEALRPGEQISVGSLTVVFTDLRDSTRLYSQIGDAPAFGRVMNHFDILEAAIAAEGGAIVKTIGDAVMAVFRRPLAALQAVINAQHNLHLAQGGEDPLSLKAGIHTGACIAVTLNERLDYFGSTVNIAARLAHLAEGGDIVLSHSMCADPEVAAWLSAPGQVEIEAFQALLKGFETSFELRRIILCEVA